MFKKTVLISTVVALFVVTGNARDMNAQNNVETYKGQNKGQHRGQHRGQNRGQNGNNSNTAVSELTATQKVDLLFMLEEEKVALDVYSYLYEIWNHRVFSNIAKSEQKHVDAVKRLVTKYNLEPSSTLNMPGSFENEKLQALYDSLIEKGSSSLVDALEVGVIVEETDIKDLEEILELDVPADFEKVYEKLLKASYKHLKAFNRQLSK